MIIIMMRLYGAKIVILVGITSFTTPPVAAARAFLSGVASASGIDAEMPDYES